MDACVENIIECWSLFSGTILAVLAIVHRSMTCREGCDTLLLARGSGPIFRLFLMG